MMGGSGRFIVLVVLTAFATAAGMALAALKGGRSRTDLILGTTITTSAVILALT